MKTIVILDGNNLAYGLYAKFSQSRTGLLRSQAGIPTTVTFGMLRSLERFARDHRVDRAVVAWDVGGGSAWRKSIYPQYKGNREYKDMEDYFVELENGRNFLAQFGINQAPCKGIEADDVIGWLCKRYESEGWKVIIYSNDQDYYQLLSKNVRNWRPMAEEMVDKRTAEERKKVPVHRIYLLDGLVGQPKDNIAGGCDLDSNGVMIKFGFGPAKGLALLNHPDNKEQTLSQVSRILKGDPKNCPVSDGHTAQLLRNWKQIILSAKISRIRTRDRHYSKSELKKLRKVYKQSMANEPILGRSISNLASMLDINSIDVIGICRKIGVNVQGKGRKSQQRKKSKVKV